MVSMKMKITVPIAIGIISIIAVIMTLVALTSIIIPAMQEEHERECHYDGGKVTGFMQCTRVHMDYAFDPATVRINLGALDPQNKNPISPKVMTVMLGENNTVTWLNTDGSSHFINFEHFAIGPIRQGDRQLITFNDTRVYRYFSADSPAISGTVIVKWNSDENDLRKYANIMEELNTQATVYQKDGKQEKFNLQMITMQEKQRKIASEILRVKIFDAYVAKGWNYPFKDTSEIRPMTGTDEIQICNIPENIPTHLKAIQKSDMFQIFAGKYSQDTLSIDISDERYSNGTVHYDLSAISDDELFSAITHFHLDSCTNKMKWEYFLLCKDLKNGGHVSTGERSEIISSLESHEFCNIKLEPWHQEIRDYQSRIHDETIKIQQEIEVAMYNGDETYVLNSEMRRLGLLSNIARHYESNYEDLSQMQEDLKKYEQRFGDIPDELLKLLKQIK